MNELLRNRTIDIHNCSITMLKLDEYNRILTVHYSLASCYISDECVRRSLIQYVTLLLRHRTIDILNYSITMLKLDEFNRILTVHYSYTSLFSCDACVGRSLVQYVTELLRNRTIDIHNYQHYNAILMTFLNDGKECIEFVGT